MVDSQDRRLIEAAIAAQEQLRETLGDDIVDATVAALRAQLQAADFSIEHERRLVTVLFMDVVDSTRILRGIDPEETMTIMDATLQALAEPIRAYGGRVTRFMGDGFLAVFGIKRTRENDAEMAVRAGLDILDLSHTVADDVARAHHIAGLKVRIGVNTGLVVTGGTTEAEDTIMGSAVNLASRIESAAPPGGMLVSQSTYRQVRGRFDLEAAGTIDAKGFPEPIPVHLVLGERSDTATTTRGIDDIDVELVGRAGELDTLLEAFESVSTGGDGRTVTIIGDAGVGKSRLLAEFESRLDAPVNTFRARAGLEDADVPHSLLRDLVERCFAIRSDDPVTLVQDKLAAGLGAYLAEGPTKPAKIDIIGQFLGYTMPGDVALGPQQLRDRAVNHLTEFLRTASTSGPLLLLFDDMQWADDSSLSVLEEIIGELAANPVLAIGLIRPEGRRATWERLPNHTLLLLDPLSTQESESLIDGILSKIDTCPPELRTRLLEYAGGNPYYLEELVMMCIDDGVIVVDGPAWSVRQDRLAALNVPSTLTGVIRARLDGLPSPEHTVLQQASVVGRVFWDEAIARIAGSTTTDTIDEYLRSLAARQMIDARTQSTFSHADEYAFSHTLVRDTTYEEVLLSTRRRYHGIVADWLINTSGDRESEFVGLIAGHLEKAGRPAEALEYLARAAEAALNSYAITTAADFYDRAIALTPDDDLERRYHLLLGRERTSALKGDRDEQRKDLDELEQVATAIGDPAKQAAVGIQRSYLHFYTGDYRAALTSAEHAAENAATAEDPALESRAQTAKAWASNYLEDWKTARAYGERALALARKGTHSEASAQNLLGMIALTAGELSESRTRLGRALHIADETGDRDGAAIYLNNLAVVLTMLGDYPGAYEHFSEVLDRAVENGDRSGEGSAAVNLAWVASATGDWEAARDHAERGISMKRRQEHREGEAEGLLWLGDALVGLERFDEAKSAFTASAEIRQELDQIALGLGARAGLARAALARGDVAKARSYAEVILRHIDEGEQLEGTWEPLRIHLTVAEALEAAGDERAERVLRHAHQLLLEHAAKIADSDDRRCYLEAIPWHRRIGDLAAALAD